jgi:hypothetical protein
MIKKNNILSIANNLNDNELESIIIKLQKILLDRMFPKNKKGERQMKK